MATVTDLDIDKVGPLRQTALLRVLLKLTGVVHEALVELNKEITAKLTSVSDEEGFIPAVAYHGIRVFVDGSWESTFQSLLKHFQAGRAIGAALPFGEMAAYHDHYIHNVFEEADPEVSIAARNVVWFENQLQEILDETAARVYGDGLILSDRIWRLDTNSRKGIIDIIYETVANGDSAWNGAKRVEKYLGAGEDCPRWTQARLRLTKAQIASGDAAGLRSGNPCGSEGVAYNALRLMRNEIQIAHHSATDRIFARLPFVEKEKVMLSPAHPVPDICDDIVAGGDDGDGVYEKGTILLPLHVQCLCYKLAVMMSNADFQDRMRGWITGANEWLEMDDYAGWIGASRRNILTQLGAEVIDNLGYQLVIWSSDNEAVIDEVLEEML